MEKIAAESEIKEEIKKDNQAESVSVFTPSEQPVQLTAPVVPAPKKKSGMAGKIVALAIGCTIAGMAMGAGGVIAFDVLHGHGRPGRTRIEKVDRSGRFDLDGRQDSSRNRYDGNSDGQKTERRKRDQDYSDGYQRGQERNRQGDSNNRPQGGWNHGNRDRKDNGADKQTTDPDSGKTPETPDPAPSESTGGTESNTSA